MRVLKNLDFNRARYTDSKLSEILSIIFRKGQEKEKSFLGIKFYRWYVTHKNNEFSMHLILNFWNKFAIREDYRSSKDIKNPANE